MKKLMILVMCLGVVYGATAQQGHVVAGGFHGRVYYVPHVSVGFGYFSPFYNPFGYYGYPYGMYNPYGMAYGRPSKLQRKEEDIRSDYADRIYSVRQDSSLTGKQKRQAIRSLKKQRDQDIHDLVANYHKQPVNQQPLNQPKDQ
jgi:hypothetical protein